MISLHYSNYKSFLEIHTESIIEFCRQPSRRKLGITNLDEKVQLHFGDIVPDFEALLKADPVILKRIKDEYDLRKTPAQQALIKRDLGVKTLYDYFVNDEFYNTKRNINYGSRFLAYKLDVFTCPYCNENFIYYFDYRGGTSIRRTFDWDHFYSESKYPFLAISFFNLLPCCKVCNHLKLNQDLDYCSPHFDLNINDIYRFFLNPLGAGFISNADQIQLNILYVKRRTYKDQVKVTANSVGLLSRMRQHKELIKDILNKKLFYPNPYLEFVNGTLSGLNTGVTTSELKNTLYGTRFNHEEYYKRPFSKLTDDILKSSDSKF
jgi:hypothetical protein